MEDETAQPRAGLPRPPGPPRGAANNPPNRFERIVLEPDPDWAEDDVPLPRTQFFRDHSCSILSYNDSPDIPYEASVNPYRGCEHGCIYCYARPFHEYLGFSAGLDFESRIMVKADAPALLRAELSSPRWQPKTIALSGVTDPYQPVERKLKLTRGCLEVLAEFRNPVCIATKNSLVTRDLDLLGELARHQAVSATLSITTLDPALRRVLEPRTAPPASRLDTLTALAKAGVPAGVLVAPVIPGLTDHELPRILRAAAEAGARYASYVVLRLPHAVAGMFEDWLATHCPTKREKVLNRIRAMRDGELNDARFGTRMRGEGWQAEQVNRLFHVACRRAGLPEEGPTLSTAFFRRPAGMQLGLFETEEAR
jgi:DNA repair photolyase